MTMRKILALGLACSLLAACSGADGDANKATGNDGAAAANAQAAGQSGNVAEALAGAADHSSFAQALQSAGLVETVRGVGPYTVFAPTNAAFQAIPEDVRGRLNAPEQREQLIGLLSYHIVPGTVTAADLGRAIAQAEGGRAVLATVTGDNLTLSRDGDAILITDGAG